MAKIVAENAGAIEDLKTKLISMEEELSVKRAEEDVEKGLRAKIADLEEQTTEKNKVMFKLIVRCPYLSQFLCSFHCVRLPFHHYYFSEYPSSDAETVRHEKDSATRAQNR